MTAEKWDFDTIHSHIDFVVRHMVVSKIRGRFTKWSGSFLFDEAAPEASSVEVQIDPESVDTHEPQRDGHLRTGDFFDVAKFPQWTFKSTKIEKTGADTFNVTGDLTLRGVTRPVVLHVESGGIVKDPMGNIRTGFSAKTSVNRQDFGISFNMTLDQGGIAIGDKVDISLDVEAVKPKAA